MIRRLECAPTPAYSSASGGSGHHFSCVRPASLACLGPMGGLPRARYRWLPRALVPALGLAALAGGCHHAAPGASTSADGGPTVEVDGGEDLTAQSAVAPGPSAAAPTPGAAAGRPAERQAAPRHHRLRRHRLQRAARHLQEARLPPRRHPRRRARPSPRASRAARAAGTRFSRTASSAPARTRRPTWITRSSRPPRAGPNLKTALPYPLRLRARRAPALHPRPDHGGAVQVRDQAPGAPRLVQGQPRRGLEGHPRRERRRHRRARRARSPTRSSASSASARTRRRSASARSSAARATPIPIPFWLEGGKRRIPNISDYKTKGSRSSPTAPAATPASR